MRYFYRSIVLKAILLWVLFPAVTVYGQTDVTIGTGTTTNTDWLWPCPLQDSKTAARSQYLYLASELTAAGMGAGNINSIKFTVASLGNYMTVDDTVENVIIKIGTTGNGSLTSTTWETGTQQVFGPKTIKATIGANTFIFSTPFFWNGADNIVIEVCTDMTPGGNTTANPYVTLTSGLSFNGSHTISDNFNGSMCDQPGQSYQQGGSMTDRPNIIFNYTPAPPCTTAGLAGGNTVTNKASVCGGEVFKLSLQGATLATGLTYQWQSSADNTTFTNITGATAASLETKQTASAWYRCVVTCAAGGSQNSVPVQVLTPPLIQGTFTIDKSLPSSATNFRSFQDAYNFIKCGISGNVVFNVAAGGVYTEQLTFNKIPGATATSTITFNGNGAALQYAPSTTLERWIVKLDGADYFVFNNLNVTATGTTTSFYGYPFLLTNDADSNRITNCTISTLSHASSVNFAGIVVSSSATTPTATGNAMCDGNEFSNNTIKGGRYGITIVGGTSVANGNNKILNNQFTDFGQTGIYLANSFNTIIDGNTLSRPATTATPTSEINAIYVTGTTTRLTINKNTITRLVSATGTTTNTYGIRFATAPGVGGLENVVSNNLLYNLNANRNVYGIYNNLSHNALYYHNTVLLEGTGASTTVDHFTTAFYESDATGLQIINNNFVVTRGGLATSTAIWFNTPIGDIVSDHNNLYITTGLGKRQLGYHDGKGQFLLLDLKQATGSDAHSTTVDPRFVDIATGNLRPTHPALYKAGANVGIGTDITNAARNVNTPDVGAFEFSPPPCTAPPTPGTTNISVAGLCQATNFSVYLTGNSIGLGQSMQWEYSANATGPWSPLGTAGVSEVYQGPATSTLYYRAAITCGGTTVYSTPVSLTVSLSLPAGLYTINKNAAASATNFQSFNAAIAAMACGIGGAVVFDVVPNSGTYTEQVIMPAIKGTSATNTITFNGNGNTLAYGSNNSDQRAVIKLDGADHITFDSLIIDATTGTYGYAVQLLNDADSNTVKRSTIRSSTTSTSDAFAGIVISASHTDPIATGNTWCDGNVFDRNTISGGYYSVTVAGDPVDWQGGDNFINNNKITNNTIRDFYTKGIYLNGTRKTIMDGNIFTRPTRTGVTAFYGVHADGNNASMSIQKNRFTNPYGGNTASTQAFYGFYGDYAGHSDGDAIIANNAFYNINGSGAQYGFYFNGGRELRIYHNTINFDNKSLPITSTAATYGFYQSGATGAIYTYNNILSITRNGGGNKYAYYVSSGDVVFMFTDSNVYHINGTGNNFIGYRNANRTTLKEWQDAVHRDLHTLTIDPVFRDAASGNLEPTIAPVNDKGAPEGITTDINGMPRHPLTPDIGAWEFAPEPCLSGVLAGAASATPNGNFCLGTNIALNLSGHTTSGYQKYVWQFATAVGGPWTNISDSLNVPGYTTKATGSGYYRATVTCTGITAISTPVQVTMNAPLPAGVYTVGAGTGFNYPSFTAAVAAMQCGIAGAVTFNVAPGTYNEQVYIRPVAGAGLNSRVTFQSADGNAASVTLTTSATSANNYTLKLDSASYITFKNLTITGTNTTYSRVIELAGLASYDSLLNNTITTTAASVTTNTRVNIFASPLRGDYNVIKGNTITNGASAIYVAGATPNRNNRITITDNTITGYYQYGIYTAVSNPNISGNTITVTAPKNTTSYAIWSGSSDSSYLIKNNNVTISNTTGTVYGIYGSGLGTTDSLRHVEANKVIAVTGNTGTVYGLYVATLANAMVLNNVVSIKTTAANSYGLYSTAILNSSVFNNTIYNTSTGSGTNYAAYFTDNYDDRQYADIRNNVFAHGGGGKAIYLSNTDRFLSNYNLLYTSGAWLGTNGFVGDAANLAEWITSTGHDLNSIQHEPAFVSASNLTPDVNAATVWGMHGRGVQLSASNHDFNNNSRPTSLKAGVPDLGAYEFVPVAIPSAAIANPAAPAPGVRQTFMMGSDTVAAITWGATVPTGVTVKRYTGTIPPALAAGTDHMYFYVDADVTGAGNYDYKVEQFYLDPWRGFIDNEARIRLGKTDNANAWTVDAASTVNTEINVIAQSGLTYLDKLTGLTNPTIQYPSADSVKADTSNLGRRFWVGFGQSYLQYTDLFYVKMVGGDKDADVTVKIYGTSYVRTYHVPAHTMVVSESLPRSGVNSAYLNGEGLFDRGVSIESTEPIAAYAHTKSSSGLPGDGSSMLLPVGAMGFDYYALSWSQPNFFSLNIHSWFYVIADHDSTLVEITPTVKTAAGRPAGVPFYVTLNKGQVYQVMGAEFTENEALDIAGSHIRSISNASGVCYPIAVFSGNSFGLIDCGENFVPTGNFMLQQNFPTIGWGTQYITAPTSRKEVASEKQSNYFRVLVKDPATVVKVNGVALSGLKNNYYQYQSNTADVIESDKPIQVVMFMPGPSIYCDNGGNGPEMFFLVPANMGVRKAAFYTDRLNSNLSANYLTVVVPTPKLSTLKVDGNNTFDHTYAHPNKAGYTVAIKRWDGDNNSHVVEADTTFTAMSYGMIGGNSYGVNVGLALPNLTAKPGITNIYDSTGTYSDFNCIGTPYKYSVLLPVQPTSITWKFTRATGGVVPTKDSIQMAPVSTGTQVIGGKTYYRYDLKGEYLFATAGDYVVPVEYVYPAIDNCNHNAETLLNIKVVAKPVIDFAIDYSSCINDVAKFTPSLTAQAGDVLDKTYWNFGNSTTSTANIPTIQYAAIGSYNVKLDIITQEGCITTTTKQVVVKDIAPVTFVSDTVKGCPNSQVVLAIKTPQTGVTYNWYTLETGGTLAGTGTTFTINTLTATTVYWVESSLNGCISKPRKKVVAMFLPEIAVPVVSVDSAGVHVVRYTWTAVPNVTAYQVSTDGGATWITPSSGAAGLSHTISGLPGSKQVILRVKAIDPNNCKDAVSADVQALTLPDMVFLPSAFTPNGDGLNDVFKIETVARSMHMLVFNQWGEKVFESSDLNKGWDGYYKGKLQPSGTYMYVCEVVLIDGTKEVKKGAVSLVR